MASEPNQSAVASSSTLWATASKEWIIPAKPKPGRKPKKESVQPKEDDEVDSKGRRVQNRAAQRAFRERKQSQLAELQARVQLYEQGEIERNVALQNIAKKLKQENEQLRKDNEALKEEVDRLAKSSQCAQSGAPSTSTEQENADPRKRWRDEDLEQDGLALDLVSAFSSNSSVRKRARMGTDSPISVGTPNPMIMTQQQRQLYTASPPSFASSPDSVESFSPSPYSAMPIATAAHSRSPSVAMHNSSLATAFATSTSAAPHLFPSSMADHLSANTGISKHIDGVTFSEVGSGPSFDGFENCGLCSDNTPCVCRELAIQQYNLQRQQQQVQSAVAALTPTLELEIAEQKPSVINIPAATEDDAIKSTNRRGPQQSRKPTPLPEEPELILSLSNLDNLPAYQPAVPLRRSNKASEKRSTNPIFQIRLPSPEPHAASAARPPVRRAATMTVSGRKGQRTVLSEEALCSGDPSNCAACKDDDFGRAFCEALGDSAGSTSPCATCPTPETCSAEAAPTKSKALSSKVTSPLRPDPQRARSTSSLSVWTVAPSVLVNTSSSSSTPIAATGTSDQTSHKAGGSGSMLAEPSRIPANEAWRQLKSHPNIAFADLSMLADVVARRTKCSGPVVVVNPPLGSLTPERVESRSPASHERRDEGVGATRRSSESAPILLTDPHAHFRAQEHNRIFPATVQSSQETSNTGSGFSSNTNDSAPNLPASGLSLVPQEELRQCGRARLREVDSAGVLDALRILDAQFGRQ